MKKLLPVLSLSAAALLAAAPPAAALVDVDLVVQMPLAVVEVEDAGYPRDDLALLASGLIAAELAPAELIDVLAWAPAVWYLEQLADGDLFLDADAVRVDPVRRDPVRLDADPRRLRLIADRDGRWLVTTREDLVLLDLADREIERQWVVDRDVAVRDRDLDRRRFDERGRDDRGMGAYVQWLHERGLRGRELADAIHAELRRRGVPAGPKDRFDGPPPASRRFVAERLPDVLVVDGRLVELRDSRGDRHVLPPGQARQRLASAPAFDGARGDGRLARRDGDAVERGAGPGRAPGPPAERGRARGRDDRGAGPPDHAAANRGGGPPDHAAANRGGGRGEGQARAESPPGQGRGGGQGRAQAGGGGQGRNEARAGGGGGQGQGQGKAKAGGGRGQGGQGEQKATGGGGGQGQGQGKGKGRGGGGGGGR
jgi:hypothetical protein